MLLLCAAVGLLASCQPSAPAQSTAETTSPGRGAPTAAAARAAVGEYLRTQPNAALYVLDSARVNDNDGSWQVLVPRTDWAGRMPNRARFEVDKQTGQVSSQPVK